MKSIPKIISIAAIAAVLLTAVFISTLAFAQSGTWATKAPMPAARNGLSAGVVNGQLYAVGGNIDGSGNNLATVEAYDPLTDTWTSKAPMQQPRDQLAVGVVNNILYAAGGWQSPTDLNILEAYDPLTDTWTTKTPMPTARRGAVAGVANDLLYVMGGGCAGCFAGVTAVEAYDPATDTWTTKAPMSSARGAMGVATVNGIIYAIGGRSTVTGASLNTVDAYDPTTNTWTTKAPMPTARQYLGASVVDSLIYAVGGFSIDPSLSLATVEVYDPATDTWTSGTSMPNARWGLAAGTIDCSLYAIGGSISDGSTVVGTNEAFTPSTLCATPTPCPTADTWTTKASMPTPVIQAAGVVFNGQFYVLDGASNGGISAPEVYDPVTNSWSFRAPDPVSRAESAAGVINNKIYLAEGWLNSDSNAPTTALEVYDPATDSWTSGAPSLIARGGSARAVIGTKLYVAGGSKFGNFVKFSDLEIYDGLTNSWSTGAPMPMAIEYPAGAAINGKFYVVGGDYGPTNTNNIPSGFLFIYDPATNSWSTGAPLPTPRTGLAAGVINGRLYAVGGSGSSGLVSTVEIYDPASNSWTTGSAEPTARYLHVAGVIDSTLYVTGGYSASGIDGTLDVFNTNCSPTPTPTPTPTTTPTPTPTPTACTTVTNTSDGGPGSLRQAIACANSNPGSDTVSFNIPTSDPGFNGSVFTIRPLSALPTLTDSGTTIDGATQTVFAGNSNAAGPEVAINGGLMGFSAPFGGGLNIPSSGNHINSLVINGFNNTGISITGAGATGNLVTGCFLGTDASGAGAVPNSFDGMVINQGASNNVVGGTSPLNRNLISGNARNGMTIGTGATGNQVQGNFIGTNSSGNAPVANGSHGVLVNGTANNTIGGSTTGARNVISGNTLIGINIGGPTATGNQVQGNFIGTNAAGDASVPNGSIGININGSGNTIGGTSAGARNVISGNNQDGVRIIGTAATMNLVQGNYIGTDATGTLAVGNVQNGVSINGAPNNTLAGNVISATKVNTTGGGGSGVIIFGTGATGNTLRGNYIGTNANGTAPLGNLNGVVIAQSNNRIGGTANGEGNVIAFNNANGILVLSDPSPAFAGNAILHNSIFSNVGLGIDLSGFGTPDGVTANDSCDGDTGANNFQNSPVLTSVNSSGGSTTIQATLNSTPNTTFTIEFFSNDACDPSGFGEGQTFIGSTTVTTDGNCNASFMFISTSALSGQFITATATDPNGNTSEFSACGFVNADVSIINTASPNPVVTGSDVTYTLAVNYTGPAPAVNVTVADDLPPQTTFKSNSAPAGWICTTPAVGANGTVTCTKPSMAPGETAMFTIVATVDCSVADGIVISDTATVSSATTDSNATNNSSAANVTASNPPPTITCPANVTITTSLGSNSAAVSYPAPNASDNCGVPIVSCSLPSGSSFPIGTTTVNCTATDSSNNTSSCTFSVTVLTPQGVTQQVDNAVNTLVSQGVLSQGNGNALTSKLQAAIASMNSGNTTAACNQLQAFINETQAFINSGKLTLAQGQALIDSASAVKGVIGC